MYLFHFIEIFSAKEKKKKKDVEIEVCKVTYFTLF